MVQKLLKKKKKNKVELEAERLERERIEALEEQERLRMCEQARLESEQRALELRRRRASARASELRLLAKESDEEASYFSEKQWRMVAACEAARERKEWRAFADCSLVLATKRDMDVNTHLSEMYEALASTSELPLGLATKAVARLQKLATVISNLEVDAYSRADDKIVSQCQRSLARLRDAILSEIDCATVHTLQHADEAGQQDDTKKGEIYVTAIEVRLPDYGFWTRACPPSRISVKGNKGKWVSAATRTTLPSLVAPRGGDEIESHALSVDAGCGTNFPTSEKSNANGGTTGLCCASGGSGATRTPYSSFTMSNATKNETSAHIPLMRFDWEDDGVCADMCDLARLGSIRVGIWANLAQKSSRGPFKQLSFPDVDLHIDLPKSLGMQRLGARAVFLPFVHVARRYRLPARASANARPWNGEDHDPASSRNVPFMSLASEDGGDDERTGDCCWNNHHVRLDIASSAKHNIATTASFDKIDPTEEEDANMLSSERMMLLGGAFLIEILELPPGPREIKSKLRMQRVTSLAALLKFQHFPPGVDSAHVPTRFAPGLNQYFRARVKVPDGILAAPELLKIAWWDAARGRFIDGTTTQVEYDVTTREVAFNASRSGLLALAQPKTVDLPYAKWSLTASLPIVADGPSETEVACCRLSLTTPRFELVIEICAELENKDDTFRRDCDLLCHPSTSAAQYTASCRLISPRDVPELASLVGLGAQPLSPGCLVAALRRTGLCISPENADCAALGLDPPKTTTLEEKLCKEIAGLASSFDFASIDQSHESDLVAGYESDRVAFRARESTVFLGLEGADSHDYKTLLVAVDATSYTQKETLDVAGTVPWDGLKCGFVKCTAHVHVDVETTRAPVSDVRDDRVTAADEEDNNITKRNAEDSTNSRNRPSDNETKAKAEVKGEHGAAAAIMEAEDTSTFFLILLPPRFTPYPILFPFTTVFGCTLWLRLWRMLWRSLL